MSAVLPGTAGMAKRSPNSSPCRAAQHGVGGGIREADQPLLIDDDDAVVGRADNRIEGPLANVEGRCKLSRRSTPSTLQRRVATSSGELSAIGMAFVADGGGVRRPVSASFSRSDLEVAVGSRWARSGGNGVEYIWTPRKPALTCRYADPDGRTSPTRFFKPSLAIAVC